MTYLAVLLGALLAGAFVVVSRRLGAARERVMYAVGLPAAASVYVVFAAVGAASLVPRELLGVVLFGAVGFVGARRAPLLLALGWAAHVIWDVRLHPPGVIDGVPWWYPPFCIGFDLVVAARVLVTAIRARS